MKRAFENLIPLKSLSYWRFARLSKCILSGAYPSAVISATGRPTPSSRSQLIGKIFHSQMEVVHGLISSGKLTAANFRNGFNTTVEGIALDVERNPAARHLGDIRLWPEITEMYVSLRTLLELRRGEENVITYSEETLYSRDRLLFGQLDAFFVSHDGIDLVDYKSGAMAQGEVPKADYVDQLYFYAYLVNENYDKYPKTLKLIGRNMQCIDLEPSVERSDLIAEEMRLALKNYNALICQPDYHEKITSPSVEACSYCDALPVCGAFWEVAPNLDLPTRSQAVIGTQALPWSQTKQGAFVLSIDVEEGSLKRGGLKLTGVQPERYPHVQDRVGQRLMLLNIKVVGDAAATIAETTDRTVILALDG